MPVSDALINKYRPRTWKEVVGHQSEVASLRDAVANKTSHGFLFSGKPGSGKTTLMRLVGHYLGAEPGDIDEIPAAVFTGVEDMRALTEGYQYRPLNSEVKVAILDECFAGGTLVETPTGSKRIDTLCVGDIVNGARGPARVGRVLQKRVPLSRIVCMRLDNGARILCSEDHLFLSQEGWFAAKDMRGRSCPRQISDSLLAVSDRVLGQNAGSPVLQCVPRKGLSSLWEKIRSQTVIYFPNVLNGLWEHIGGKPPTRPAFPGIPTSFERWAAPFPRIVSGDVASVSGPIVTADEAAQSYERPKSCCEDAQNASQNRFDQSFDWSSRWERQTHNTATSPLEFVGLPGRARNRDRELSRRRFWLSYLVQGGFSLSRYSVGDRGRRGGPQTQAIRSFGSKEGIEAEGIGVVGVSRYELAGGQGCGRRGSTDIKIDGGFAEFFDLTIEGHPSYKIEGGVTVHNCHRLSKNAWDSILKIVEEPPPWLYWGFCTTELNKIPPAVKRRCMVFDLKEVSKNTLTDFLDQVADEEGLTELDCGVLDICAREAHGSPGQALANLALCTQAKDRAEAAALLHAAVVEDKDSATGELVRGLMANAPWEKLQPILYAMREVDAESVRYAVRGYLGKILLETGDPRKAAGLMNLLEPFAVPFYHISDVAVAVGKIVFEQS